MGARNLTQCRLEPRIPQVADECRERAPAACLDLKASDAARQSLSQAALGDRLNPQSQDFVSVIGFGDGYAVVEAGFVAGPLYGGGTCYLLEQVGGEWVILDLIGGWIS